MLPGSSLKHFNIVSVDLEGWTDTRNGHFLVLVPVRPPPLQYPDHVRTAASNVAKSLPPPPIL